MAGVFCPLDQRISSESRSPHGNDVVSIAADPMHKPQVSGVVLKVILLLVPEK